MTLTLILTPRLRARYGLAWLGLLGMAACGVTEHRHATGGIDTSDDFGSISTTPATPEVAGESGDTPAGESADPMGAAEIGEAAGALPLAPVAENDAPSNGTVATPAAPLSGITISLNGVDVPKERAIAFIHVGHSNMAGRATRPNASRPYHFQQTHPHAWMYHPGSPPALAIEPRTAGDTAAGGPGTALVKEAAMLAPDYYFVSLGFGVPSAYCSQFLPNGLYYDQLIAAPLAIKDRVTFGAIFLYLGITERHGTEADRTGFADCINALTTAIRKDVGVPDLPLLINDYEVEGTGEFAVGRAVANAIMPQIAKIPATVSNSALVSAEGLGMQDNHHFNLDGHRAWVQRALSTMQEKGWFLGAP
jgi:hypothetical protein